MLSPADIEQMGLEERLKTMEMLWESIARTPDAVPSPEWHGQVVAERLAKLERGEGELLTLDEAKARLLKPKP